MTAEITKSVLLPNTLALPLRPSSIIALLVALLGGQDCVQDLTQLPGESLLHRVKLFFWMQC